MTSYSPSTMLTEAQDLPLGDAHTGICACPACMAHAAVDSDQRANGTANSINGLVAEGGTARWNENQPRGTPVVIQYSFMETVAAGTTSHNGANPAATFKVFDATLRTITRDILDKISQASGLTFVEVADGTPTALLQLGRFTIDDASGYAYYPSLTSSGRAFGPAGDVWIDTDLTDTSAGAYLRSTIVHEIGHALGLKHPFEDDAAHQLPAKYDNSFYTVMTYNTVGADNTNMIFVPVVQNGVLKSIQYQYVYREQMAVFDIDALQFLYGPSVAAGGDSTYKFGNTPFVTTIADAGGNDTIDASAATLASSINLAPYSFSSIAVRTAAQWVDLLMTQITAPESQDRSFLLGAIQGHASEMYSGQNNLSIAAGTVIENAIGGAGNDTLTGNTADNRLTGNGGNDTLDGLTGWDTAVFGGARTGYQATRNTDGTIKVVGSGAAAGDGTDTLRNIEVLQFADKTLFNVSGQDATIARLYGAAFGRAPDAGGLNVQLGALHAGLTVDQLAGNFLGSAEFKSRYGANPSNSTYATALYSNVLGRSPDAGGLAVQVDALDHGLSRVQLLINFADSAENKTKVLGDWLLA